MASMKKITAGKWGEKFCQKMDEIAKVPEKIVAGKLGEKFYRKMDEKRKASNCGGNIVVKNLKWGNSREK